MTQEDFERAIKVLQKHNQELIAENKRLKQEPCDDVVSRQAVYEILEGNWNTDFLRAEVEKLPSVRPQEQKTEKVFKMRDATPEEREAIDKYIKSISKPTGIDFWDLDKQPCDDAISKQAVLDIVSDMRGLARNDVLADAIKRIEKLPPVRPLEQTGKCRTCKYGEIYNDLWCKCHDPLLDGVMVKMTDQCRAEEIIDLNRKYKAESEDKDDSSRID